MKEYRKDKRLLIPRDEFEEEASEGLGRLSREEAEADLCELKARFEGRLRRPRAIWIPAAAAVVLLLAASAVVVSLLRERPAPDSQFAQNESAKEGMTYDDSISLAAAGGVVTDTALIAMARPIEKEERAPIAPAAKGVIIPSMPETTDEVYTIVSEDAVMEVVDDEPVVSLAVVGEEMAEVVVVEAIPQARAAAVKARTVTETREVAESRDEKKAVATKDVADKSEPAAGAAAPVIQSPAAPSGGWLKYAEWAAGNIRYPSGVQPVVRQEVFVSFTVLPDSTLTDLKAVSSPGEPFTREAFRLLREGPRWEPATSGGKVVAKEVMVKVVFK